MPQFPQNRGRAGEGGCGTVPSVLPGGGGGGVCSAYAARPQESQKRAPASSIAPQEEQVGAGAGTFRGETFVFVPQVPQNFSSGRRGLPQEVQAVSCAGSALSAGGGGIGSTACEAPQFRQNLAVVVTLYPHSAQNGMINHQSILCPA